jgi:general secretion pathway protein B
LKRAERERAQAQNPVAGDAAPTPAASRGTSNTLLKLLIAALAVNAIVIAVLVLRHKPDTKAAATNSVAPASSAQLAAAPAKPGIITAPAPKPPPPQDEPAEEAPAVQEGVSSMDDLGANDADQEQSGEGPPVARSPAVAAVEHHGSVTYSRKPLTPEAPPPQAQTEEAAQPEADQADTDQPAAEEAPAPVPSQEIANAQPSAPPPPATAAAPQTSSSPAASASGSVKPLSEMSAAYQGAFPQFTLQVHVYDSAPQKRFAIIDGTRYREGDTLPQGARLEQIVAEGLVIDFRNERVLFPIGRH